MLKNHPFRFVNCPLFWAGRGKGEANWSIIVFFGGSRKGGKRSCESLCLEAFNFWLRG